MKFCTNCGTRIPDGAGACPACGKAIDGPETKTEAPGAEQQPAANPNPGYQNQQNYQSQQSYQNPYSARNTQYYPPQTPAPAVIVPNSAAQEPAGIGFYLLMFCAGLIPLVGLISHIVIACTAENKSKKNFCIAVLIFIAITVVLVLLFGAVLAGLAESILSNLSGYSGLM